jgi:hypothetical protein
LHGARQLFVLHSWFNSLLFGFEFQANDIVLCPRCLFLLAGALYGKTKQVPIEIPLSRFHRDFYVLDFVDTLHHIWAI